MKKKKKVGGGLKGHFGNKKRGQKVCLMVWEYDLRDCMIKLHETFTESRILSDRLEPGH